MLNHNRLNKDLDNVLKTVKEGKLEVSLDNLVKILKPDHQEFETKLIALTFSLSDLKKDYHQGILSEEEKRKEKLKIATSLIEIVQKVKTIIFRDKIKEYLLESDNFNLNVSLPPVGKFFRKTDNYNPPLFIGLKANKISPLKFDFLFDTGDEQLEYSEIKEIASKQILYFFTSLITPSDKIWVNLSPTNPDEIISEELSNTIMGIDLLCEDYNLKQFNASLFYPHNKAGKDFWDRSFAKLHEKFGPSDRSVNTFNKVWIVPQKSSLIQYNNIGIIDQARLNVLLEKDYLTLKQHIATKDIYGDIDLEEGEIIGNISAETMKATLLPLIDNEVNNCKTFSVTRQIYACLILSKWYKSISREEIDKTIRLPKHKQESSNQRSTYNSIEDNIYNRYVEAYQKGVFTTIKPNYNRYINKLDIKVYFSGGFTAQNIAESTKVSTKTSSDFIEEIKNNGKLYWVSVELLNPNDEDEEDNEPIVPDSSKPTKTAGIDFSVVSPLEIIRYDDKDEIILDFKSYEFEKFMTNMHDNLVPIISKIKPVDINDIL